MEQKTPLYDIHIAEGGKMVPFAGYLLPVQYEAGVVKEHMAVRTGCGIFDVSHMGEVLCTGPDSLKFLNYLMTNNFSGMLDGQARYSPMCNEQGGVIDDLIVYRIKEDCYFIVVNASNRTKDFLWMKSRCQGRVDLQDISSETAQIALQGPYAQAVLEKITSFADLPSRYYSAVFQAEAAGLNCVISRTGYTGEKGFELYLAAKDASSLWNELTKEGKEFGLLPCGLGARDTLRLEAGMPLYGHEMTEEITPLEAGLGNFVKMEKSEFIGKQALLEKGVPARTRAGLKVTGRGIVRENCPVFSGEQPVGVSTSGTYLPYLGFPGAMALLQSSFAIPGTALTAEVRGRRIPVEVVRLPFYKGNK